MHSTLGQAVWVRALARNIGLCSWVRHCDSASFHPDFLMITSEFNAFNGLASHIPSHLMLQKPGYPMANICRLYFFTLLY